ncbi:hypothetical protein ACYCVF_31170 [Bradyrhizobium sp. 1.29L]
MGALREAVRDPVVERLRKRKRAGVTVVAVKKVRSKLGPVASAQVEVALKYMRAKRIQAHKGEVRARTFTNAQLRNAGLGHLAELNEALGVKES